MIFLFLILISGSALSCPSLEGRYLCENSPANTVLQIEKFDEKPTYHLKTIAPGSGHSLDIRIADGVTREKNERTWQTICLPETMRTYITSTKDGYDVLEIEDYYFDANEDFKRSYLIEVRNPISGKVVHTSEIEEACKSIL